MDFVLFVDIKIIFLRQNVIFFIVHSQHSKAMNGQPKEKSEILRTYFSYIEKVCKGWNHAVIFECKMTRGTAKYEKA